jgi:prepilin-type N-terminal cleavage/methylation domain-containing protein
VKHNRANIIGFTLIELLAAIVVMSIISVTIMPVIAAASESYTVARQVRSSTERAGYALDRITRVVRQAPIGTGSSGIGISAAGLSAVVFSDGSGFQLTDTTLEMLVPGENPTPLCFNVSSFTVRYLGDDGVSDTILTPTQTHRLAFTIITENVEMSVVVLPRVWIGQVTP